MTTLGIDLSSMPEGTAACCIEWKSGRAVASSPHMACTDEQLDQLIRHANVIGIDAPFGWPTEFVAAVRQWTSPAWNEEIRDRLRFRETDRWVKDRFKLAPLSVSSDRIALPAMRAMALLQRHGVTDRSGDGRFFEVYPAGSLSQWGLQSEGYKKQKEGHRARRDILAALRAKLPWLEVPELTAATADGLDSLIAALTVRCAAQAATFLPEPAQRELARREGWIHLPTGFPTL